MRQHAMDSIRDDLVEQVRGGTAGWRYLWESYGVQHCGLQTRSVEG
jgi:hypothetical protein